MGGVGITTGMKKVLALASKARNDSDKGHSSSSNAAKSNSGSRTKSAESSRAERTVAKKGVKEASRQPKQEPEDKKKGERASSGLARQVGSASTPSALLPRSRGGTVAESDSEVEICAGRSKAVAGNKRRSHDRDVEEEDRASISGQKRRKRG